MRHYEFGGSWVVPAPPERVQSTLVDLEFYPEWWPEVRAVASLGPDDALVVCRSWLPYSLELHLTAVRRDPELLETRLGGDLEGHARWRLAPHPRGTRLDYEQSCRVTGRLLAVASYAARPLLVRNHERMMSSCVAGLGRRLSAVDV